MNGYWKFHRAMYEHPIWKRPMATRLVWITILGYANFTEKEWLYKGTRVIVPSGTWITTQDHLSELAGVSRKQVRSAIKDLIALESIRANQRANRYTEICIVNWPIYQSNELIEGQPKGQERANQGPTKGQDVIRKEGKKERKEEYTSEFISFWDHYPRKESKQDAWKAWNQIAPQNGLVETILSSVEQHKQKWTDPQFIPLPASYLRGRRWEDVLVIAPKPTQRDPKSIWKSQEEYLAHKKRAGIDPRYRVPEWEPTV
jgi:hypothetical protein